MTNEAELKQTVERQQEFVAWLKERGLYNPYESAVTMQAMHNVWEACHPTPDSVPVPDARLVEAMAEIHKLATANYYDRQFPQAMLAIATIAQEFDATYAIEKPLPESVITGPGDEFRQVSGRLYILREALSTAPSKAVPVELVNKLALTLQVIDGLLKSEITTDEYKVNAVRMYAAIALRGIGKLRDGE